MIIYGLHSVFSFLKNRPDIIKKVFIAPQIKPQLAQQFKNFLHKTVILSNHELNTISKSNDHQGICAEIDGFPYATLHDNYNTICILDHIEDPRNLGAIIRNALAFKIDCLIIPKDRASNLTPSAIKASAGAAAIIPIIKVSNINQIINQLKNNNYWVYGFEASGENKLSAIKFDAKSVLVLGSEGKGISQLTRKLCDFVVSVEMNLDASSLNVSSCAAIVFYKRFVQS